MPELICSVGNSIHCTASHEPKKKSAARPCTVPGFLNSTSRRPYRPNSSSVTIRDDVFVLDTVDPMVRPSHSAQRGKGRRGADEDHPEWQRPGSRKCDPRNAFWSLYPCGREGFSRGHLTSRPDSWDRSRTPSICCFTAYFFCVAPPS